MLLVVVASVVLGIVWAMANWQRLEEVTAREVAKMLDPGGKVSEMLAADEVAERDLRPRKPRAASHGACVHCGGPIRYEDHTVTDWVKDLGAEGGEGELVRCGPCFQAFHGPREARTPDEVAES